MPTQALPWTSPDLPIVSAPPLSEEEEFAIRERMRLLDQILAKKGKAKYKVEVFLGSARTNMKPTPGMISFWESGAKLHGGGDAKIYICPGFIKNQDGSIKGKGPCGAFIPDASHGQAHLLCLTCHTLWAGEEVVGELFARLTMQQWAPLITRCYSRLSCNADVVLKYAADDIRSRALQEQQRQKGGEILEKARARRLRATAVYPLLHIIQDTSGGQDLTKQFYKFLHA